MNTDYIYWTFTAAAQCVSTFVALLLTGYALVLSQIEAARDRDDSLQEIHAALRKTYHARLTVLAWLTAIAVGMSLVVVWINRANEAAPTPLVITAALMDVVAMVAGLAFVVVIIDPDKYQKAAERELEQQAGLKPGQRLAPAVEFFRAFRKLERLLRERCRRLEPDAEEAVEAALQASGTIRRMADLLLQGEHLSDELYAELMEINRYRNLLFHGDMKQADPAMVERVKQAGLKVRLLGNSPLKGGGGGQ